MVSGQWSVVSGLMLGHGLLTVPRETDRRSPALRETFGHAKGGRTSEGRVAAKWFALRVQLIHTPTQAPPLRRSTEAPNPRACSTSQWNTKTSENHVIYVVFTLCSRFHGVSAGL